MRKVQVLGMACLILGLSHSVQAHVLWHNSSTGETQIWQTKDEKVTGRATVLGEDGSAAYVGPPFSIVGTGDFNRDGSADILWHNSSTGETQIWLMKDQKVTGRATVLGEDGSAASVGLPFSIVGTGDFNRDGASDILWHNASTGETQIWQTKDQRVTGRATVLGEDGSAASVGLPFSIVGTGDFNRDGASDILWHNASTGETQIWLMKDQRVISRATVLGEDGRAAYVGLPFSIVGTSDFNQDGATDILWHNASTGETQIWLMKDQRVTGRATVLGETGSAASVGLPWSIVGTVGTVGTSAVDQHQSSVATIKYHQVGACNGYNTGSGAVSVGPNAAYVVFKIEGVDNTQSSSDFNFDPSLLYVEASRRQFVDSDTKFAQDLGVFTTVPVTVQQGKEVGLDGYSVVVVSTSNQNGSAEANGTSYMLSYDRQASDPGILMNKTNATQTTWQQTDDCQVMPLR